MFFQKNKIKITLRVEGLRCTDCESQVAITIHKVPGVKTVNIRKRKYITIGCDSNKADILPEVIDAIERSGYSVANE
jgi:copper chaperone CopZ